MNSLDGRSRGSFVTLPRVTCRLVLVCVCCALALTACSKPEEGSTLPPLPSASPSPSPSPSKSAGPVDDKAAIVALARDYYLARNQAIRTGNTASLRKLSTPNCPCKAFADRIDADWRRGRVDSPNFYTIVDVRVPILDNETAGRVTVLYRKNRYIVLSQSGQVLTDVPAESTTVSSSVRLRRTSEGWKVSDVLRL